MLREAERMDDLYCTACGNPMVVNTDGTTNHLVEGSVGVDEVDYDADEDHTAISE